MRIGVVQTQVPFVKGGAERHSANLCQALRRHGHEVAEITLPFKWYPEDTLIDSIVAANLIDLSEVEGVPTDLMIGLRFPAYLARHPNKVFWIIHQYRQAYDQWDAGTSDLLPLPNGDSIRHLVRAEDKKAFAESKKSIFANSRTVAARLKAYLGQDAVPLYHPPPNAALLAPGDYGDYLFAPGRLNRSKRPELLLHALSYSDPQTRLVLAGVAENPAYFQELQHLSAQLGVAERVSWLGGIDDETMRRYYANARAVLFVPQDEDYGYITLEAMLSGKAVITTTDAGGPLEFISDQKHGLVCAPNPKALGEGFDAVMQDRHLAQRMGEAGYDHYKAMNITWDHVVETLTGQTAPVDILRPDQASQVQTGASNEAVASPIDGQEDAVALLRAAIAPSQQSPSGFPFSSITEVMQAYEFNSIQSRDLEGTAPIDAGLASYLSTHWQRYLTTLDLVTQKSPRAILDVGVFPPLVFEAMLVNLLPDIALHGVWEGPTPYAQKISSHKADYPDFDILLKPANIERDRMPYGENCFDLVLGMEIFEHLALDPFFFLSEVNRVLRPEGHILLSTPNIGSHRGVWKTLNGYSPYSFGIFVPTGGVYGRHNREYTPHEVEALARSAGFETEILKTVDVYDSKIDPAIAELLVARGDNLALRGETIFYLGRKVAPPSAPPEGFYHGAPGKMSGRLTVVSHEKKTGLVHINVENISSEWWPADGAFATQVLAAWIAPDGVLRHPGTPLALSDAVAPSGHQKLVLCIDPDDQSQKSGDVEKTVGMLRLDLMQAGVGVITGTGRSNAIFLPCSEASFLEIVKQGL